MRKILFFLCYLFFYFPFVKAENKNISVTENIAYRTDVGESTTLDLALPNFGPQSDRPAIIIIHGGGWNAGSKDDMVYRALMIDYALKGYVVANVNYRLTREAPMPACIEDVRCAVRWMKENAQNLGIDPNRIGSFGHSAGGHLSLMLGLNIENGAFEDENSPWINQSSSIACAVGGAPPTEIGNPAIPWAQHPEWWPIGYIGEVSTPFLILQGAEDPIVKPELTEDWVYKMQQAGSSIEYLKVPGDHSVAFDRQLHLTRPAMDNFFAEKLQHNLD